MDWRTELKNYLYLKIGKVWYEWGGQDPENGVADCSGLVVAALKHVGAWPTYWPADLTAQGLRERCRSVRDPLPGDLCFYGRGRVSHVMIYLGKVHDIDQAVIGMTQGVKDQQASYSKLIGAALWLRVTPFYRRDFIGYGRIPSQ